MSLSNYSLEIWRLILLDGDFPKELATHSTDTTLDPGEYLRSRLTVQISKQISHVAVALRQLDQALKWWKTLQIENAEEEQDGVPTEMMAGLAAELALPTEALSAGSGTLYATAGRPRAH